VAPSTPTRLVAVPGDARASISWSPSTDNYAVKGYKVFRDGVPAIKRIFNDVVGFFSDIGKKIGRALSSGFKAAVSGIGTALKAVLNTVVSALNGVIHGINKITGVGGIAKALGADLHIPDIPKLAAGGIATRSVLARIGEAGREAVIPLTQNVLRQLGLAISVASAPALRGGLQPALAGGGPVNRGTHIEHFHAHVKAPAGELPDAQSTATALTRLMERRAGGSPRQD